MRGFNFKDGDIVRIKPNWCDTPSEAHLLYMVANVNENTDRYVINLLNPETPLGHSETVSSEMILLFKQRYELQPSDIPNIVGCENLTAEGVTFLFCDNSKQVVFFDSYKYDYSWVDFENVLKMFYNVSVRMSLNQRYSDYSAFMAKNTESRKSEIPLKFGTVLGFDKLSEPTCTGDTFLVRVVNSQGAVQTYGFMKLVDIIYSGSPAAKANPYLLSPSVLKPCFRKPSYPFSRVYKELSDFYKKHKK